MRLYKEMQVASVRTPPPPAATEEEEKPPQQPASRTGDAAALRARLQRARAARLALSAMHDAKKEVEVTSVW